MGKKLQGAKLRAKKRANAAVEELQERLAEEDAIHRQSDSLIVIDTTGETVPHHQRPAKKQKFVKKTLSEKDQILVDKLKNTHNPEELKKIAEQGAKVLERAYGGTRTTRNSSKTNFDLWDSNSSSQKNESNANDITNSTTKSALKVAGIAPMHVTVRSSTTRNTKPKGVAVDVVGGQSYHPDPVMHQKLLRKAATLEQKRDHAIKEATNPISQGLSAETKALLLGDSDDDDESDDEPPNDDSNIETIQRRQDANKLTRAQRNKQKRVRAQLAMERNAKKQKKLENQISEIPRYKKELKALEMQQKQKKMSHSQPVTPEIPGTNLEFKAASVDPIHAPSVPVALLQEKGGSLRRIAPKGNLCTDRTLSLADRNMLARFSKHPDDVHKRQRSQKRAKKAVKGSANRDAFGPDFEILG
jgi:nucleolar protein 53